MAGTNVVGTSSTIARTATPLTGWGASTTTTSVAGAAARRSMQVTSLPRSRALAEPEADDATGPASLGPLLEQMNAAVEALRQVLEGSGGP